MSSAPGDDMLAPDDALARLGRIRLAEYSMPRLLEEIAALAQQSLPGHPETSVTLLSGGRATTAAFAGRLARELDEAQYRLGHGPCLHAADSGEPVEIPETRTDSRWPDFTRLAAAGGCRSSLALPLPLHEGINGALNIYARHPRAFDDRSRGFALRFASYSAVVAGNMLLLESALDRARNLEVALASRAVIDQAKGVLMERFKITADRAFQELARVSMETNTKVRDVAERFVTTGELDARSDGAGGGIRTRS